MKDTAYLIIVLLPVATSRRRMGTKNEIKGEAIGHSCLQSPTSLTDMFVKLPESTLGVTS